MEKFEIILEGSLTLVIGLVLIIWREKIIKIYYKNTADAINLTYQNKDNNWWYLRFTKWNIRWIFIFGGYFLILCGGLAIIGNLFN